jgi:hypothetical protein
VLGVLGVVETISFIVFMCGLLLLLCLSVLILISSVLGILTLERIPKNREEMDSVICFILTIFVLISFILMLNTEIAFNEPKYYRTGDVVTVNAMYDKKLSYNYKDVDGYVLGEDKYNKYNGESNLSVEVQLKNGDTLQFTVEHYDVDNFATVIESPSSLKEYNDDNIPDIYTWLNKGLLGSKFKYSYIILFLLLLVDILYYYSAFCHEECDEP